jgi:hypothetical protein
MDPAEALPTGVIALMTCLIGAAGLLCLGWSMLSPAEPWDVEGQSGTLARLRKRKERWLRSIKDLEHEREAGLISEEELREMRNDLKRHAIEAAKSLELVRRARLRSIMKRKRGLWPAERKRIEELVKARAGRAVGAASAEGMTAGGGSR